MNFLDPITIANKLTVTGDCNISGSIASVQQYWTGYLNAIPTANSTIVPGTKFTQSSAVNLTMATNGTIALPTAGKWSLNLMSCNGTSAYLHGLIITPPSASAYTQWQYVPAATLGNSFGNLAVSAYYDAGTTVGVVYTWSTNTIQTGATNSRLSVTRG